MEITIKDGGQLERVNNSKGKPVLETIKIAHESGRTVCVWINDSSLSYLSVSEAMDIRDALNEAIKQATGV